MSLTEKHRWCIKKILETFTPELDGETIQAFMRQESTMTKFASFFRGEGSGRLFCFYQPMEDGEFKTEVEGPKQLSISDGNSGLMMYKSCYFVRNTPPGEALDLSKSGETDLLFGELGDSALGTIEAILSQSYRPMIDEYDSWGKVDDEHKADFVSEIGAFITNINEAVVSFANGLELQGPDAKIMKTIEQRGNRIGLSSEITDHFEKLLTDWCNQIEKYLNKPTAPADADDVGPRGELEYWRGRMQKLTSITEQLKRPDCKQVIAHLSTLTKNATDAGKHNIIALLRRYKQIDVDITESANEAKDNVKYLFTLERFIEP